VRAFKLLPGLPGTSGNDEIHGVLVYRLELGATVLAHLVIFVKVSLGRFSHTLKPDSIAAMETLTMPGVDDAYGFYYALAKRLSWENQ